MKKTVLMLGFALSASLIQAQYNNTLYGTNAGNPSNPGNNNSFFGANAGDVCIYSENTGIGSSALRSNTVGNWNSAVGSHSLRFNTNGTGNSALGYYSLYNNTSGWNNTAVGTRALRYNTTGEENTAIGGYSLEDNTDAIKNTAVGYRSIANNSTGDENTGVGHYVMLSNNTGTGNTAMGSSSLYYLVGGFNNTAIGRKSLYNNTASNNTALGYEAGRETTTGAYNTAVGYRAIFSNTTGGYNVGLGYNTYVNNNASYASALGAFSTASASWEVVVGSAFASSIGGYQNWTNLSDGRFKREIKEDVMGLDFIKELRPVSYYVDNHAVNEFLGVELDEKTAAVVAQQKATYQTGFIAQEVEATAKKLGFDHFNGVDAPQNEKDHYGLRYAEFVVPLVKSVQELSAQNEAQTQTIEELKALVAQQQVQIEQLLNNSSTSTTEPAASSAQLHQNIPNPHQGQTQIKVFIPESSQQAFLQVTDLSGKQLMVETIPTVGEQTLTLTTEKLEAGMYLYTLVVDQEIIATKKMVVAQ